MSLRELVWGDTRAMIASQGESASLSPPASLGVSPFVAPAKLLRRGMTRTPDGAGFAAVGDASYLTVSLTELASLGISDPESLKLKGWTATIDGVAYRFAGAPIDYTRGEATITLKRSDA